MKARKLDSQIANVASLNAQTCLASHSLKAMSSG